MTKMAVYQPRRAAIATILVAVMQDDIREELLGRHKRGSHRKKCSTNMAVPRTHLLGCISNYYSTSRCLVF